VGGGESTDLREVDVLVGTRYWDPSPRSVFSPPFYCCTHFHVVELPRNFPNFEKCPNKACGVSQSMQRARVCKAGTCVLVNLLTYCPFQIIFMLPRRYGYVKMPATSELLCSAPPPPPRGGVGEGWGGCLGGGGGGVGGCIKG
jgi:hypothetical protein